MSALTHWETHPTTGKRYFRCRAQGGQIFYQLEDGTRLTQSQFDQLTGNQVPRAIPRHATGTTSVLFPRDDDQEALREPVGRPPLVGNYAVVRQDRPRDTATRHQDLASGNPSQAAPIYISGRNTQRPSEQATSGNPDTATTKDTTRPAQHAMPSRMSRLCMNFVSIPVGNYSKLSLFILENNAIVSHNEIDSLIAQAREEQLLGHETNAQKFVHHALLLRRCRGLNAKECELLFRQLDDGNSEVCRDFLNDVNRIHSILKTSARPSSQTLESSDTQRQGQGLPFEYQTGARRSRHGADRPVQRRSSANITHSEDPGARLAQGQSFAPDVNPQVRRVQTTDDGEVRVNETRHVIRTASARHTDLDEVSSRMTSWNMAEAAPRDTRIQDTRSVGSVGPTRHVEDSNPAQKAPMLNRNASVSYGDPMPALHEGKVGAGREFKGTDGDSDGLDPRYRKRNDAEKFFIRGRVFSLLWHEPTDQSGSDMSKPFMLTRGRFGTEIYSYILRMVVVKEGHGVSLCLPIHTYRGRGVSKPGFSKADREAHAIIYMSDTEPRRLPEEIGMEKKPIAVDKANHDQKLDQMSRINFSRVHTVMWNVKVMNVGKVARESMPALVSYWRQALE